MVRELIATQNYEQIERICKVLSEQFVLSQNGNSRRGGLIGIAALAIACGKVSPAQSCPFLSHPSLNRKRTDTSSILFHLFYNVSWTTMPKFDTMRVNHCTILQKSFEQ